MRFSEMILAAACIAAACNPLEPPKCSDSDPCRWEGSGRGFDYFKLVRDRDKLVVITIISGGVCFWDGTCGGEFATDDAAKSDGERAAYRGRHAIGS